MHLESRGFEPLKSSLLHDFFLQNYAIVASTPSARILGVE